MLPKDFIESTRATFGKALWEQYLGAFDVPAPVSIRLNRRKAAADMVVYEKEEVAWCADGFYLSERPQFTFDPLMHAGAYYVQEASQVQEPLRHRAALPDTVPSAAWQGPQTKGPEGVHGPTHVGLCWKAVVQQNPLGGAASVS